MGGTQKTLTNCLSCVSMFWHYICENIYIYILGENLHFKQMAKNMYKYNHIQIYIFCVLKPSCFSIIMYNILSLNCFHVAFISVLLFFFVFLASFSFYIFYLKRNLSFLKNFVNIRKKVVKEKCKLQSNLI